MSDSWKSDNCSAMKGALCCLFCSARGGFMVWCNIEIILEEATQLSHSGFGRGVWKHPAVPCLEPRSRALLMV